MEFVTDRTHYDVLIESEKGRYSVNDLNRVETAVKQLAEMLTATGTQYDPTVKTNWAVGDLIFSSDMERYLGNISRLCELAEVPADLPQSMDKLTWDGANKIEIALMAVYEKLTNV
jgi:hypothetical protein